jgi:formylglycine-generating enzyme required for sulfatase activity
VTQAEWKAVMENNPSYFNGDDRPVECVSWDDCQTFISRLSSLTGRSFSLPTEAQWEFAARGGNSSRSYQYSGSYFVGDVAWYVDNSGNETHDVGTKSANELGLYDMSGNVMEWCSDWYGDYSSNSQTNPTGPYSGSYRVFRGGSWRNDAGHCRVSYRAGNASDSRSYHIGLRLVL